MDGLVLGISCMRGCRVAICAKYLLANVSIPAFFRYLLRIEFVILADSSGEMVLFCFGPGLSSTFSASAGVSCLSIKSYTLCDVSRLGVPSCDSLVSSNW